MYLQLNPNFSSSIFFEDHLQHFDIFSDIVLSLIQKNYNITLEKTCYALILLNISQNQQYQNDVFHYPKGQLLLIFHQHNCLGNGASTTDLLHLFDLFGLFD